MIKHVETDMELISPYGFLQLPLLSYDDYVANVCVSQNLLCYMTLYVVYAWAAQYSNKLIWFDSDLIWFDLIWFDAGTLFVIKILRSENCR